MYFVAWSICSNPLPVCQCPTPSSKLPWTVVWLAWYYHSSSHACRDRAWAAKASTLPREDPAEGRDQAPSCGCSYLKLWKKMSTTSNRIHHPQEVWYDLDYLEKCIIFKVSQEQNSISIPSLFCFINKQMKNNKLDSFAHRSVLWKL